MARRSFVATPIARVLFTPHLRRPTRHGRGLLPGSLQSIFLASILLLAGCGTLPTEPTPGGAVSGTSETAVVADWYLRHGGTGDGRSEASPAGSFTTIADATAPGDVLVLLPGEAALDGGVVLKEGQHLVGRGGDGSTPVLTNTTAEPDGGVGVTLAPGARVSGIRVEDTRASAVLGINADRVLLRDLEIDNPNTAAASTDHVLEALAQPMAHGGVLFITTGAGESLDATLQRVVITGATGFGLGHFVSQGARGTVRVEEARVEGGRPAGVYDNGAFAVAQGEGSAARMTLSRSRLAGRPSPAARNVAIMASHGAEAEGRLERVEVGPSGQDGVIAIASAVPATVRLHVERSTIEGAAQTNLEGTILNLPPHDPAGLGDTRIELTVVNSVLRDAGGDGPFAGQGANLFAGGSALAQQMGLADGVPFLPGSYQITIRDSELLGADAHGVVIGNDGEPWGTGPETATFAVESAGNRIQGNGAGAVLVRAPATRISSTRDCLQARDGDDPVGFQVAEGIDGVAIRAGDPADCDEPTR